MLGFARQSRDCKAMRKMKGIMGQFMAPQQPVEDQTLLTQLSIVGGALRSKQLQQMNKQSESKGSQVAWWTASTTTNSLKP
jgi:hypothetical protein